MYHDSYKPEIWGLELPFEKLKWGVQSHGRDQQL